MGKIDKKIIVVVVVFILVVSVGVLGVRSELFQGKFSINSGRQTPSYYWYKGSVVSVVTSPVSSVVVSEVTSEVPSEVTSPAGTSIVVSEVTSSVPSVVTSPVASAVGVDVKTSSKIDAANLKALTEQILRSAEKKDYIKNPSKFTLSAKEKAKIIELYEKNNGL